jgi:hypothetical protein
MTAFAITNHENLRYWTISAGIVVLMHGAIAAAVLSWRNATAPMERPGPVVIDLAPIPAAPPADQGTVPPAAASVPSLAQSNQPFERVEENKERTAARSEQKAGPFEEAPSASAPVTLAPPEEPQTRAATGGAVPGAASSYQNEPIDTRIGEPRRFKNPARASDWKKAITDHPSSAAGPSRNFGARLAARGPAAPGDATGGSARNSVGVLTQDISGVASSKAISGAEGAKNALGIAATTGNNAVASNPGIATNAIGLAVPLRVSSPKTNSRQHGSVGLLAFGEATPNGVINGTAMVRPASATAAIGGPAKNVGGVINGTMIRPR